MSAIKMSHGTAKRFFWEMLITSASFFQVAARKVFESVTSQAKSHPAAWVLVKFCVTKKPKRKILPPKTGSYGLHFGQGVMRGEERREQTFLRLRGAIFSQFFQTEWWKICDHRVGWLKFDEKKMVGYFLPNLATSYLCWLLSRPNKIAFSKNTNFARSLGMWINRRRVPLSWLSTFLHSVLEQICHHPFDPELRLNGLHQSRMC